MQGAKLKGDDSVEDVVQCMDHDSVLFFTSDGVVRSLKAHQIPQASRTAIGTAITQVSLTLTTRPPPPPPPLLLPLGLPQVLPYQQICTVWLLLPVKARLQTLAMLGHAGLAGPGGAVLC